MSHIETMLQNDSRVPYLQCAQHHCTTLRCCRLCLQINTVVHCCTKGLFVLYRYVDRLCRYCFFPCYAFQILYSGTYYGVINV